MKKLIEKWNRLRERIAMAIVPKPLYQLLSAAAALSRARERAGYPYGPLGMPQEKAHRVAEILGVSDEGWKELQREFYQPADMVTFISLPAAKIARFLGLRFYFGEETMLREFKPLETPSAEGALAVAARYQQWKAAQPPGDVPLEEFYPHPLEEHSDYGPIHPKQLKKFPTQEHERDAARRGVRVIADY